MRGPSEEQAQTPLMQDARIGRGSAALLAGALIVLMVTPVAYQLAVRPGQYAQWLRPLRGRLPTEESLHRLEGDLSRESALGRRVRSTYHGLALRGLGQGSERVVLGRSGFLFYREDIDLCAGLRRAEEPGRGLKQEVGGGTKAAALAAIRGYDQALKARGVHLLVAPVPVAPTLYPEEVWPAYPAAAGPAWLPGYAQWLAALREAGVDAVDLSAPLWAAKEKEGAQAPLYLRQNSHWSPEGIAVAAGAVARRITEQPGLLPEAGGTVFTTRSRSMLVHSDYLVMLELPSNWTGFPLPSHQFTQVFAGAAPALPGDEAPVLLIGDSFSRIFTGEDAGDIESAGFAHQIMLRLGAPVQEIVENGGNPESLRRRVLARGEVLRKKRVLIWEFSVRFLGPRYGGLWNQVPLPPPQ